MSPQHAHEARPNTPIHAQDDLRFSAPKITKPLHGALALGLSQIFSARVISPVPAHEHRPASRFAPQLLALQTERNIAPL